MVGRPAAVPGPAAPSRIPAMTSVQTSHPTVDLSVEVGPLRLANPLMTASGTAGLGLELEPFMGLAEAGAIVVKTLTKQPRRGNAMPRLVETPSGLLNSIGLPNKGIDHFIAEGCCRAWRARPTASSSTSRARAPASSARWPGSSTPARASTDSS